MRIRKRSLRLGWYPEDGASVLRSVENFLSASPQTATQNAVAGVAPHAGWEFSGAIACEVLRNLDASVRTVVVVGGHLGPEDGIVGAVEDGYETPLGALEADTELLALLRESVDLEPDRAPDNTVEVQLPLLKALLPGAKALSLRAPPAPCAADLGRALASLQDRMGARLAVLGSTDLTHYGPNYGFCTAGEGEPARRWVREVNDRRFLESLLSLDLPEALHRAVRERSACSAGGAVAAAAFARASGVRAGKLLRYDTSWSVHPAESFVGYAAVVYAPDP